MWVKDRLPMCACAQGQIYILVSVSVCVFMLCAWLRTCVGNEDLCKWVYMHEQVYHAWIQSMDICVQARERMETNVLYENARTYKNHYFSGIHTSLCIWVFILLFPFILRYKYINGGISLPERFHPVKIFQFLSITKQGLYPMHL